MHKPGLIPYNTMTITASATAEALPNVRCNNGVILTADLSNGVDVYVGYDSLVTSTHYHVRMQPGDRTPLLPISNLKQIYVYAVFTTETHNITYALF